MGKVIIHKFKQDNDCSRLLKDLAEVDYDEVYIVGVKDDSLTVSYSPLKDMFTTIGRLRALEYSIMTGDGYE